MILMIKITNNIEIFRPSLAIANVTGSLGRAQFLVGKPTSNTTIELERAVRSYHEPRATRRRPNDGKTKENRRRKSCHSFSSPHSFFPHFERFSGACELFETVAFSSTQQASKKKRGGMREKVTIKSLKTAPVEFKDTIKKQ